MYLTVVPEFLFHKKFFSNLCLLDFRLALLDFLSFDLEDVLDLLLLLFLFLDSSSVLDEADEEVEVWKESVKSH